MIRRFGLPGAIVSVVSDSYDLFAALDLWGGELRQAVLDSGATLVVRPDSGDGGDRAADRARARRIVRLDRERQGGVC